MEELRCKNGNQNKLNLVEKIMHLCAHMGEKEVLMVFKVTHIISHNIKSNSKHDMDKTDAMSSKKTNLQKYNNSVTAKEVNLSLNSNTQKNESFDNPHNHSNCWSIEDKGFAFSALNLNPFMNLFLFSRLFLILLKYF